MVMFLAGKDPRRGDQQFLYVMPHAGGWGGFEGGDGEDGLINNVNGGFKDYPVEVFEVKYPALIRALRVPAGHRRPGRFRGGCGLLPPVRRRARGLRLPLARAVGHAGLGPVRGPRRRRAGGRDQRRPPRRAADAEGERPPARGGIGRRPDDRRRRRLRRATERDPARVRDDVIDGFVSREAAERDYGVVLDEASNVDEEATRKLRESA